ncbi:MAG: NAD(P)H-quinone oxidoreductase [Streptosporangiaceae bacterium]
MQAIVVEEPGGPEVLRWAKVDHPTPQSGEVVVDVTAAGVNRADVMQRLGHYPPPQGTAPYPGLECSGRISAVGRGVSGWAVGDRVCALLAGGGYAERVSVPAGQLLPVPDGVSLLEAAGLPEVACTVQSNVFTVGRLQPGETLLVHGGSSGVGTFAIQLARHVDARVLCTAGTEDKLRRCRELGADVGINYREEDFVARVKEETDGRGVDVILDVVGAKYLPQNIDALAPGGRLVVIGLLGGRKGELDLGKMLGKRASISATSLRARPVEEKARIVASVREHVWPAVAMGAVRPVVDRVLPMNEAAEAHRVMESSAHVGKIILRV